MTKKQRRSAAALKGWETRRKNATATVAAAKVVAKVAAPQAVNKRRAAALKGWETRRKNATAKVEAVARLAQATVRIPVQRKAVVGIPGGRLAAMSALIYGPRMSTAERAADVGRRLGGNW